MQKKNKDPSIFTPILGSNSIENPILEWEPTRIIILCYLIYVKLILHVRSRGSGRLRHEKIAVVIQIVAIKLFPYYAFVSYDNNLSLLQLL